MCCPALRCAARCAFAGACVRSDESLVLSCPPIFWKRLCHIDTAFGTDFGEVDQPAVQLLASLATAVPDDFDAFGMGTVVAIGRIFDIAAGVTDTGLLDTGHLADQILHAPETSAGKYCTFAHLDILHLVEIVAISFSHHVGFGYEPQGCGIDAVAQASRFGAVFEYVSEVTTALSTKHFVSHHS